MTIPPVRFIVDESTGLAVVEYLRRHGHDVLAVSDSMPQVADRDVIAQALRDERILITNDKDFGELVFRQGLAIPGVILLRLHDEHSANRIRVIGALLAQYADRLVGHFVVATEGNVRVQKMAGPV